MNIFAIVGPSGVGKSLLVSELVKEDFYSIPVFTDRAKRPGEKKVVDREYLTVEEFDKFLEKFIYWFEFQGHRYGYKKSDIEKCKRKNLNACLNITPTHLPYLINKLPELITIYLRVLPDNYDLLFKRMVKRDISSEDSESAKEDKIDKIKSRLNHALSEEENFGSLELFLTQNRFSRVFNIAGDGELFDDVLPYILSVCA